MSTEKSRSEKVTRVLVVDDSVVFQQALVQLYDEDADMKVVATAGTARDAVHKTLLLKPDVISLDLGLPDKDGFEVVREVMAEQPTPILVLTATLNPSWRREAYYALTLGAVDIAEKPSAGEFNDLGWRRGMRERLRVVARSRVLPHVHTKVRRRRESLEPRRHRPAEKPATDPLPQAPVRPHLIVIVGSAGSPRAVSALLQEMRPAMPLAVPMVIAMHLGPHMGSSLARFLCHDIDVDAQALQNGHKLQSGVTYVAPGGVHVQAEADGTVRLFEELPAATHRPSLDHLLTSVAMRYGGRAVGVILTGMGSDGAQGLLRLRQAGGLTLCQDADSCLVTSMPNAAKDLGAVVRELTLAELAATLLRVATHSGDR